MEFLIKKYKLPKATRYILPNCFPKGSLNLLFHNVEYYCFVPLILYMKNVNFVEALTM